MRTGTKTGFASWHVLVALAFICVILLWVQRRSDAQDVAIATGPPSAEQKQFFEQAADRPDLNLFFKALSPRRRLLMARNLGQYATPGITTAVVRLLPTYDEAARDGLIQSLAQIASTDASLVANELSQGGSFERAGLFEALSSIGEKGIRAAAGVLGDPTKSPNAILFLVQSGSRAIPALLPILEDPEAEVRKGAAEALGKLRSREAVPALLQLASKAGPEDRPAYLMALSEIGDVRAERVLLDALESSKTPESTSLLNGLGRIGSPRGLSKLVEIHRQGGPEEQESALAALALAGDRGIAFVQEPPLRLKLAARSYSAIADAAIRESLRSPILVGAALQASKGRERLVDAVWPAGGSHSFVALRLEVLCTTRPGLDRLRQLAASGAHVGLAKRALRLQR